MRILRTTVSVVRNAKKYHTTSFRSFFFILLTQIEVLKIIQLECWEKRNDWTEQILEVVISRKWRFQHSVAGKLLLLSNFQHWLFMEVTFSALGDRIEIKGDGELSLQHHNEKEDNVRVIFPLLQDGERSSWERIRSPNPLCRAFS